MLVAGFSYLVEEMWKPTISAESKHHPRVGRHGEKTTMPYTNHNKCHEGNCSILTENINQNLQDRLASLAVNGAVKVLD